MASLLGFASAGYGYTVVVLLTFFVCVCVRFQDFSHELNQNFFWKRFLLEISTTAVIQKQQYKEVVDGAVLIHT